MDDLSGVRVELIDGVAVAMTGASRRHNRVAGQLYRLLDDLARPQFCDTYIEGTRLQLGEDTYVYPDVMVTCEGDTNEYDVLAPCLVVEVLSPSTSWVDHGRKRTKYLSMPSLKHYLLISLKSESVEHFYRSADSEVWKFELLASNESLNGILNLTCPAGKIPLAAIFA